MSRAVYSTDLTNTDWTLLKPLVPAIKSGGRPAVYPRRMIISAIQDVLRTGCAGSSYPSSLNGYFGSCHFLDYDYCTEFLHQGQIKTGDNFGGVVRSPKNEGFLGCKGVFEHLPQPLILDQLRLWSRQYS